MLPHTHSTLREKVWDMAIEQFVAHTVECGHRYVKLIPVWVKTWSMKSELSETSLESRAEALQKLKSQEQQGRKSYFLLLASWLDYMTS